MIILFEGVDGSGKTTLLKNIAELLLNRGIEYQIDDRLKVGTMPNSDLRLNIADLWPLMIQMASDKTIYLCDRGPLSDIIYRTFDKTGEEPVMDLSALETFIKLRKHLNHHGLAIVITDTNDSEKNMLKRGEDNPVAIEHHNSIRYLYQQIGKAIGAITHDYKYDITEVTLGEILGVLNYDFKR